MIFTRKIPALLVILLILSSAQQALSQNSTANRVADTVTSVGSSLANATESLANSTVNTVSSARNATQNAANATSNALRNATSAASSVLNVTGSEIVVLPGNLLVSLVAAAQSDISSPADASAVLEGTELESAVAENADAQEYREDPVVPVRAQIVSQEPAAELANGDADLSTTGQDADTRCTAIAPHTYNQSQMQLSCTILCQHIAVLLPAIP